MYLSKNSRIASTKLSSRHTHLEHALWTRSAQNIARVDSVRATPAVLEKKLQCLFHHRKRDPIPGNVGFVEADVIGELGQKTRYQ